jgi:hypothetical protein
MASNSRNQQQQQPTTNNDADSMLNPSNMYQTGFEKHVESLIQLLQNFACITFGFG